MSERRDAVQKFALITGGAFAAVFVSAVTLALMPGAAEAPALEAPAPEVQSYTVVFRPPATIHGASSSVSMRTSETLGIGSYYRIGTRVSADPAKNGEWTYSFSTVPRSAGSGALAFVTYEAGKTQSGNDR